MESNEQILGRSALSRARRVVVKIGSARCRGGWHGASWLAGTPQRRA